MSGWWWSTRWPQMWLITLTGQGELPDSIAQEQVLFAIPSYNFRRRVKSASFLSHKVETGRQSSSG